MWWNCIFYLNVKICVSMCLSLLGYSEGQKTMGLFHKFFIFPPLHTTTFHFWPSFLASYMGSQYKIVYSITLRGYFVLDGQGYKPSILPPSATLITILYV